MHCNSANGRPFTNTPVAMKCAAIGALILFSTSAAYAQQGQGVAPADTFPGEHMQCYRIPRSDPVKPEAIVVADQFGKSEIVLGRPVLLCNPSTKARNGRSYGVPRVRRNIHLVCYEIRRPQTVRRQVEFANQFAASRTTVDQRQIFCAPSSKKLLSGKEFPLD